MDVEAGHRQAGDPGGLTVDTLPIYWKLMGASVKAKMEYKASFLLFLVAVIIYYGGQLGVILVVLNRFQHIKGWELSEIAFLYGLLVFSQGITSILFNALNTFDDLIVQGNFDRYLVRPLDPMLQIICNRFEVSSIAHFVIGITALVFGSVKAGIVWTPGKILFFPVVVAGAVLIQGAIRLGVSTAAFWTTRNRPLVHTLVFSSKEFIYYPISIYNAGIQFLLTFLFPLAFINFYPSYFFLNHTGDTLFHPYFQYGTPVVGIVSFWATTVFWKYGTQKYQSVGH